MDAPVRKVAQDEHGDLQLLPLARVQAQHFLRLALFGLERLQGEDRGVSQLAGLCRRPQVVIVAQCFSLVKHLSPFISISLK
mmetsp:Transcript_1807/g.2580  ORF Transcript_1807/g.2580 Transcript_1807/m.2580 type:complete len:82 (-) Transcript_1807:26-271(-)